MIYLISQFIALIAFLFSLVAYHRKTKKKILENMLIANILNLIHYLLLNAYSGCITKFLAILRDYFIILKEKNSKLSSKKYLFVFILLYVLAAIFTYNGILSLLPLVAALIYIIVIWNGNELDVKKVALFCYFLWLAYNIFVLSIVGIISNSVSIISAFVAVMNYSKKKSKEV